MMIFTRVHNDATSIVMLHELHVIQIIEVLLYIEALHAKALHFKANCMDYFKK
jgi:HKD family nuclease